LGLYMNSILYFAINTNLAHYPTIKSYNKELDDIFLKNLLIEMFLVGFKK